MLLKSFTGAGLLIALNAVAFAQSPLMPSPVMPVDVNNGGNATQNDWIAFGWRSFVAANWPSVVPPASGISGEPNVAIRIGASAPNRALVPTVWLTWRTASSTFLPMAVNPGVWNNSPQLLPAGCKALQPTTPVAPGFAPMMLDMTSKLANNKATPIDDVNQASGNPLIDQFGWYVTYDIRMAQAEYTYIQKYGYYDALAQQKAFVAPISFVGFPRTGTESMFDPPLPAWSQFGATEVKASWRVLDPAKDDLGRYYTQTGYFVQPDGKTCEGPALFGLIGFHVLRLTPSSPSTWFWATFEQDDNVTVPPNSRLKPTLAAPNTPNGACTANYNVPPPVANGNISWNDHNPPVNVCQVTDIPSDIKAANTAWRGALAGTVWANYQMVGVLNPSVPNGPRYPIPVSNSPANTDTLANTTLETFVQAPGQSCMLCHGFGFPQYAPTNSGTYQVFSFLMTNADSSNPTLAPRLGLPRQVLEIMRRSAMPKR